jgi:hypothetical protein
MGSEDPIDFINAESKRIPFKNANLGLADWNNSFRSWLSVIPGWRNWYLRVVAVKPAKWENLDIAHCIGLSLMDPEKKEPLLSAATYFWSDAMNCFLFGHRPMTSTLMDVYMLTALDISTSVKPQSIRLKTTHQFEADKKASGWKKYIIANNKLNGHVGV